MSGPVRPRLEGVIPPLVTPLRSRDELDAPALRRVIDHVIEGGVHGVFLLGTTGEGPHLSKSLQRAAVVEGCRAVGGRVPVLVNITDASLVESLKLAEIAASAGAAAVTLSPPFYAPLSQDEVVRHCRELARELPLPFVLYNIPSHAHNEYSLESIRRLAELPNCLGIKDSSARLEFLLTLVREFAHRDDYVVLAGPEEFLMDSVLAGGHGGVSGGANLYPSLYVALYNAAKARDFELALELHNRVLAVAQRIYSVCGYLRALKCALEEAGLCSALPAEPLCVPGEAERTRIRTALEELSIPRYTATV